MHSTRANYYFKYLKQHIWYLIKSLWLMELVKTSFWFAFNEGKNAVFLLKHPRSPISEWRTHAQSQYNLGLLYLAHLRCIVVLQFLCGGSLRRCMLAHSKVRPLFQFISFCSWLFLGYEWHFQERIHRCSLKILLGFFRINLDVLYGFRDTACVYGHSSSMVKWIWIRAGVW